jgi:argininosuccinate lyase
VKETTGSLRLLSEGLYRSRLGERPDEPTGRFLSSLKEDREILREDIDGTEAHDIMLCEQGVISKSDLKKILESLEKLRLEFEMGTLSIEGDYEDVHEFLEDRVIKEIGIDVGGKLHTARSRNDQVALDIRMKTRSGINELCLALIELVQVLLGKASETIDIPIVLYTHTQHAQIGSLAHYLLAQGDILLRDLDRLISCYLRVNRSPLGASAIGGTRFPINRYRTAELLGFEGLVENSVDAVSSRDFTLETVASLGILMVNMSRICEDLIVWSSSEFGYVELADAYSSTSSVMPQKKNPCTLELIRGKTGTVCASLIENLVTVKGLPTGYSRDLQAIKPSLWTVLKMVKESLEVMLGAISSMKINSERWVKATRNSYALAVDLTEILTGKGIPFRLSHKIVGALVKDLFEHRLGMKGITPSMISSLSERIAGRKIDLTDAEISYVVDPLNSLEARQSVGGPSQKEIRKMLREREQKLVEYSDLVRSRVTRLEEANSKLRRLVHEYVTG